jgi:putative ABC transport system ATP-binding protein
MALFEATELGRSYRVSSTHRIVALEALTFQIDRASFTAITGPSGSGKTTLLALLGALERPTSGRLSFDGSDLGRCSGAELTRVRRRMGIVLQDYSLIPNLSALENITYPLIARGIRSADRCRRAQDLLAGFGLGSKLNIRVRNLSGGEQQRVAIARAIAAESDVLLADEPTSNLDPATADILLSAVGDLQRRGATIVIATHDSRIVGLASTVWQLRDGRMSSERPVEIS